MEEMKVERVSPRFLRRLFSIAAISVLGLAFMGAAGFIPITEAASPSFTQRDNTAALSVSSVTSAAFSPTKGDLVIVNVQWGNTAGITITNVSAGVGGTHNSVQLAVQLIGVDTGDSGSIRSVAEYSYLIVNTGSQSVTVSFSAATGTFADIEVVEVTPAAGTTLSPTPICTSSSLGVTGQPTASSIITTTGSCPFSTASAAFASEFSFAPYTNGPQYTLYCANAITNRCTEYSGTVSGATNFPGTQSNPSGSFVVVGAVFSPPGAATSTQPVGSCPTKNTATFTMVNSTIYLYAGNALGSEVVNTVQVNVASITGSGSHTLELVVYVGTQQAINVNTPSALAFQYTKTFSPGTTNQQFTVQVNIPLNTAAAAPLPFNWWAVGVIGDNHIVLNQSSLAGLQTVTGSPPPANQPLSFTALSSNANKIALCATASYQTALPAVTSISTVTQSASSTITVTSTSVISTIGSQLFSTSSNWPVIFLILLLPAGLFLGVTKNIAGALLGLMIGAIMGTMMGILPGWAFIGIVIALAAVAFIARERG